MNTAFPAEVMQAGRKRMAFVIDMGEEIHWDVGKPEINQFTEKGRLRDAIKACISAKSRRPRDAGELTRLLATAES